MKPEIIKKETYAKCKCCGKTGFPKVKQNDYGTPFVWYCSDCVKKLNMEKVK